MSTRFSRMATALAVAFAFALALLVPVQSIAQAISGDLNGVVTDQQHLVVPNATLEATSVATGLKTTTKANDKGEFRFSNLPVGAYNVTASGTGFAATTIKNVPVELTKTNTVNFELKVGGGETTVEVSGAVPLVDTTTAQVQNNYTNLDSELLPITSAGGFTSGVLNLSLLSAGVSQASSLGDGVGPSVGGLRPRDNNFMIEGVDNNNKSVTGNVGSVPNEAVAEFSILQNQFTSEYGHSSGGQFNTVVKSGTNGFHGSVYEYFRNKELNAVDTILSVGGETSNPRYDNNRYGASLGGPIIKDKVFFFTLFERQPIGQAAVAGGQVQTPTAAGFAAINADAANLLPCTPLDLANGGPGPPNPPGHPLLVQCATDPSVPVGGVGINATNLTVFNAYVPVAASGSGCIFFFGTAANGGCGANQAEIGTISIQGPSFNNFENFVQSIDWNIGNNDKLRGRYIFNKIDSIDTAAQLPAFYQTAPTRDHVFTLAEYHSFSPTLSNEFRLGFNRFANVTPGNAFYPGLADFPNITLTDMGAAGVNIGPDPNAPQFTIQNFYGLVDNVSWNKGRHSFKFGGEYREYISPQFFTQRSRGDYFYGDGSQNNFGGTEGFLRDLAPDQFGERSSGASTYYGNQWALYWFANDTWKVTPHVTVNLGVRYEYTTTTSGERRQELNTIANDPSIITNVGVPLTFEAPQGSKNNFAPRIGIAWSPGSSGNTSIRAGFGMAYDVLYDNIGILSPPPQIGATIDTPTTGALGGAANFLAGGGLNGGGSGLTILTQAEARDITSSWLPPDRKWPVSIQWNFGIQHSFLKNYSIDVRYVGVHAYHLDVQERLNIDSKVTPTTFLPTFLTNPGQPALDALTTGLTCAGAVTTCFSAIPNFNPTYTADGWGSQIVGFVPLGHSMYHGLATQLNRRFSNGLQIQAAWTWSQTRDNSTADFFSTRLTPRRPQDFQCLQCDYSISALDRRHRVTVAVVYDMPYFKHGNWFEKNILGNWVLTPIYTYESAQPATVVSNTDSNLNGDSAGDRAILNLAAGVIPNTGSGVTPLTNTAGAVVGYLANNPTAQYIVAGRGALAMDNRNSLLTLPIDNIDFSIYKKINVTERMQFTFGAQALNLFNHAQWIPGSLNDVTGFNTTATAVTSMLTPGDPSFNHPELVFSSNPRTLTLVAKFTF